MSTKIISTEQTEGTPSATPHTPIPLTPQRFNEIAGSLHRLREIGGLTILSPSTEAELRGIKEFLSNAFLTHAESFLGAWHTVRFEYEPVLKAVAMIAHRAGAIMSRSAEVAEKMDKATAQTEAQAPEPSN